MAVRGSVQSRLAAGPRKEYGLNITFGQKDSTLHLCGENSNV